MPKINELDSQILKHLLRDGRTGYYEIAKLVGVSENKVWKRCRNMGKKGIINGATVQLNFEHFGYDAVATLLIGVEANQIEQVMEFLEKVTEVNAYQQYNSVYNVRAVATLRDLTELDHVKQVITRKLPTISLRTYIWTGVRNIPENLDLIGKMKSTGEKNQWNSNHAANSIDSKFKIDELDKQIVAKLTIDGRAPFTKIAKEIGVATDTVVKRYHKLRETGSVKVSIQIDPSKFGYASILDFNVAFMNGLSDTVVNSFAEIPDVIVITKTSGDYDLQLTAMIRDVPHAFAIQDQIARICGVTKFEASARKIPRRWPTPQQCVSTF